MGGKGRGGDGPSTAGRTANLPMSLREENSGRTCVDEASLLRVKHLQGLAAWAGAEAGVGPVGALLGRRLAASAEAAGIPLGAATFLCQRCETILKPGFNCTVRIRNKRTKTKRRKKSNRCQNSVSYACHFCGDQNLILGSGKGVVKSLLSSRGQASVGVAHRSLGGNKGNTRTQYVKDLSEHPRTEILQVNQSSRWTSERVEQGERLKLNLPTDGEMGEGATLSSVESGRLAFSSFEERSMQKIVLQSVNSSGDSSKKIETCEASVTLDGGFMVGSEFVTPQKMKLADSEEPFTTKSTRNKNGEASQSVVGKTLSNSSKSVPHDSYKRSRPATSDAAQVPGSSRKRARKKLSTLKQIAEKDEIEKKEKMGNFVIPFFLQ